MPATTRIALLGLVILGLGACDDKQAQNNTPTKPDSSKMEPQTSPAAPPAAKP